MEQPTKKILCWQCGKKLEKTFAIVEFNGSQIRIHKTCQKDAENLLFKNKVTFQGEEID